MDYLPGGKYYNASPEVQEQMSHVPPDNSLSERTFAKVDRIMQQKPNAKITYIYANVGYTTNNCSKRMKIYVKNNGIYKPFMDRARKLRIRLKKKRQREEAEIQSLRSQRVDEKGTVVLLLLI